MRTKVKSGSTHHTTVAVKCREQLSLRKLSARPEKDAAVASKLSSLAPVTLSPFGGRTFFFHRPQRDEKSTQSFGTTASSPRRTLSNPWPDAFGITCSFALLRGLSDLTFILLDCSGLEIYQNIYEQLRHNLSSLIYASFVRQSFAVSPKIFD